MTILATLAAQPADQLAKLRASVKATERRAATSNTWDNRPSWDNWRKFR